MLLTSSVGFELLAGSSAVLLPVEFSGTHWQGRLTVNQARVAIRMIPHHQSACLSPGKQNLQHSGARHRLLDWIHCHWLGLCPESFPWPPWCFKEGQYPYHKTQQWVWMVFSVHTPCHHDFPAVQVWLEQLGQLKAQIWRLTFCLLPWYHWPIWTISINVCGLWFWA